MTTNGDLYMAYVPGWRAGAAFRPVNSALSDHSDEGIRDAYADGWADGRVASKAAFKAAFKAAETTYGYSPSILRSGEETDA
jgi:hypothetical protein